MLARRGCETLLLWYSVTETRGGRARAAQRDVLRRCDLTQGEFRITMTSSCGYCNVKTLPGQTTYQDETLPI